MKTICINCPKGCELEVAKMADGTVAVSGNPSMLVTVGALGCSP